MDFTFLFIILLMMLAVKSQLWYVAVGLFVILIVTSKNKYLLVAALLGLAAVGLSSQTGISTYFGDATNWIVLGILFAILVLLAKKDSDNPTPEGYAPQGYPPYG